MEEGREGERGMDIVCVQKLIHCFIGCNLSRELVFIYFSDKFIFGTHFDTILASYTQKHATAFIGGNTSSVASKPKPYEHSRRSAGMHYNL